MANQPPEVAPRPYASPSLVFHLDRFMGGGSNDEAGSPTDEWVTFSFLGFAKLDASPRSFWIIGKPEVCAEQRVVQEG